MTCSSMPGVDPRRALDDQREGTLLWTRDHRAMDLARLPMRIVHGHTPTPFLGVDIRPGRICVDTGSGYDGGMLSAAVLAPGSEVRCLRAGPSRDGGLDIGSREGDRVPLAGWRRSGPSGVNA